MPRRYVIAIVFVLAGAGVGAIFLFKKKGTIDMKTDEPKKEDLTSKLTKNCQNHKNNCKVFEITNTLLFTKPILL